MCLCVCLSVCLFVCLVVVEQGKVMMMTTRSGGDRMIDESNSTLKNLPCRGTNEPGLCYPFRCTKPRTLTFTSPNRASHTSKPWPLPRRQARQAPPWSAQEQRRGRLREWTLRAPQPRTRSRESATRELYEIHAFNWGTHQVVTEQLHDEGGVLVALLRQGVEL